MSSTTEKLVGFLSRFEEEPCVVETNNWWPTYTDYVEEFFRLVEREFNQKGYAQNDHDEMRAQLEDDVYISQASVDQCKTLMTFVVRGEKFCDGHMRRCVETGRVQALLRRLSVINKEEKDTMGRFTLNEMDREQLGQILADQRNRLGLTQGAIAKAASYKNNNFITMIEKGDSRIPFNRIFDIVGAYQLPTDFAFIIIRTLYPDILETTCDLMNRTPKLFQEIAKNCDEEVEKILKRF